MALVALPTLGSTNGVMTVPLRRSCRAFNFNFDFDFDFAKIA